MERVAGIEPASSAWKAEVLPLNYTRRLDTLVVGEGFEPSKAKPSDLQSDPFDHSGTPPKNLANLAYARFSLIHLIFGIFQCKTRPALAAPPQSHDANSL